MLNVLCLKEGIHCAKEKIFLPITTYVCYEEVDIIYAWKFLIYTLSCTKGYLRSKKEAVDVIESTRPSLSPDKLSRGASPLFRGHPLLTERGHVVFNPGRASSMQLQKRILSV